MPFESWRDVYHHDLQAAYAPLVAPFLFLIWRALKGAPAGGVVPAAARFVDAYAIFFAVETMLDPIATGPLVRALGLADGWGGTVVLLTFVLLGDFRVFLLVFAVAALASGQSWHALLGRAAAWTLVVPIAAYAIRGAIGAAVPLPANAIWLVYELGFFAMALYLRERWVPGALAEVRVYLRAVTAYVAAYYALWAISDLLIQVAGVDAGWALRIIPNQLYYGFWIPFVLLRFFAPRYQSTNTSVQASR